MKKRLSISAVTGLIALGATLLAAQPAAAAGITIQDPNLRACINQQLAQAADSDISQAQALTILHLACNKPFSTLSGIEQLTNLQEFLDYAPSPALTDLQPLAGLTTLQEVVFLGSSISDLSPLKTLPNLMLLEIPDGKVADVSPLGAMTKLQHLILDGNQVVDFSPLAPLLTYGTAISAKELIVLPAINVGELQDNPLRGIYGEVPVGTVTNGIVAGGSGAESWLFARANPKNTIAFADFKRLKPYPANVTLNITVQQASLATPTVLRDDVKQTKYQTSTTIDAVDNDGLGTQAPLNPATLSLLDNKGNTTNSVSLTQGKFTVKDGKILFVPAAGFSGAVPAVKYQVANFDGVVSGASILVTVGAAPAIAAKPTTIAPAAANIEQTPAAASVIPEAVPEATLANTGTHPALPLSLAGLMMLAGSAALFFARRKRA